MKNTIIQLIVFYQRTLSPDTGSLRSLYPTSGACRMFPSCSEYMKVSIEKHGTLYGVVKGIFRIGRCHPFQKNLIDMP